MSSRLRKYWRLWSLPAALLVAIGFAFAVVPERTVAQDVRDPPCTSICEPQLFEDVGLVVVQSDEDSASITLDVPDGKVLVVENVSAHVRRKSGDRVQLALQGNLAGGSTFNMVPVIGQSFTLSGFIVVNLNQQTKIFLKGNSANPPKITLLHSSATAADASVVVTGMLKEN